MGDIYAIGDIQGCYDSLQALLAQLPLSHDDTVWLCGDLVNRGPKSAEVLRWAIAQGERVQVVLGNHDLHLLAAAAGARKPKKRDTFADVLRAADCDELLSWLRSQPLARSEGGFLLVHAGVHPSWSTRQTLSIARECSLALQGGFWLPAWKKSRPVPPAWSEELVGESRIASALSVLVGVRMLHDDGRLETEFTGPPEMGPAGTAPWFTKSRTEATVVFGHWAALGLSIGTRHLGLDSGCVWGQSLSAIRLRDRKVFQQPALESLAAIE